jgi:predicted MPP superfamily phosphohydrolase
MRIITLLFTIVVTHLHAANLSGVVFIDANGNGLRDGNELGLKGVSVSDQINVVITDQNGFYLIPASKGYGFVFISTPNGYKLTRPFYQKVDINGSNAHADFALTKTSTHPQFTFVHASDTHISDKSLDRMQKFKAAVDSLRPDFVIVTGDLIKDALRVPEKEASSLFELYKSETLKFSTPFWNVPGNHEIFGIEREQSKVAITNPLYGIKMYRSYLGPDYYSFNYGSIHFVALNSVEFDDMWYFGSVDSLQREWLKKDLAAIPPNMTVVTFQHIPLLSGGLSITGYIPDGPGRTLEMAKGKMRFRHVVANAHDVLKILRTRPYSLALAGHFHTRQRFYLETEGYQTRFEQTAAIIASVEEGSLKMPSGIVYYQVKDGEIDEGAFIVIK